MSKMNFYDTLTEALEALKAKGYTNDFDLLPDQIECKKLGKCYNPNNFTVKEFHRFEGMSNPDDMSVVYAIEAADGEKGVMVDAYGTYADPPTQEMIQKLKFDPKDR